jgi:hypothetical protein
VPRRQPRPTGGDRIVKRLAHLAAGAELRAVTIDFPVGELRLDAGAGADLEVDLAVRCDRGGRRCQEQAKAVRLAIDQRGGEKRLALSGLPKFNSRGLQVAGSITVPAACELRVDMGVGQLTVSGAAADLVIHLGVGQVTLELPAREVRSVRLDAGIGEAALRLPGGWVEGQRPLLLGSEVSWDDGRGAAVVRANVGVGEVEVRLE